MHELRRAYTFLNNTHIDILDFLNGKKDVVDESKLLDFKIDWILLFSDIEKKELLNISVDSVTDLSVDALFGMCMKFCYFPEQALDVKSFKLNGVEYKLIEEIKTISGAKMLFGNGTYNQFKLAQMLARQIKGDLKPNIADSLLQLVAVLYSSDGNNSDEAINIRVKEFENVDSWTAWSCLFFFILLTKRYNAFFQSSLIEEKAVQKKLKAVLREEAKKMSFEKTRFGKLLQFKSPKSEFLILRQDLDWML